MGAGQGRYVSDQEGGSTEGIIGTPLRGSIDTASASSPLPATTAGASVAPPATSPQRRSSQRLQQECGRRVRARSTPVVRVKDTSDNTDRNRENAADGHLRVKPPAQDRIKTSRGKRVIANGEYHGTQPLLSVALRVSMAAEWIDIALAKQLQLTSTSVCADCRESISFHVRVVTRTPRRLWTEPKRTRGRGAGAPRVPKLRTGRLTFGQYYNRSVDGVRWPEGVKEIAFGQRFDQTIHNVHWPPALVRLRFGCYFNKPIAGVGSWPNGLQKLRFGCSFNQSLVSVGWPQGLQEIILGAEFDTPVSGVEWPARLKVLVLGIAFNQPVAEVVWPARLEVLVFGDAFNQPVDGVLFPASLESLEFGVNFDQEVSGIQWPAESNLTQLAFGCLFNRPVGSLPAEMEVLQFGCSWNQPVRGMNWPVGLKAVDFGYEFDQELDQVEWPSGLANIKLGASFNRSLVGVTWPTGLKRLQFGDFFDQPLGEVRWPPSLEELYFGRDFCRSLEETKWPPSLRRVVFAGESMGMDEVLGAFWPRSIEDIVVGDEMAMVDMSEV